jgi:hypothetical protein
MNVSFFFFMRFPRRPAFFALRTFLAKTGHMTLDASRL